MMRQWRAVSAACESTLNRHSAANFSLLGAVRPLTGSSLPTEVVPVERASGHMRRKLRYALNLPLGRVAARLNIDNEKSLFHQPD